MATCTDVYERMSEAVRAAGVREYSMFGNEYGDAYNVVMKANGKSTRLVVYPKTGDERGIMEQIAEAAAGLLK